MSNGRRADASARSSYSALSPVFAVPIWLVKPRPVDDQVVPSRSQRTSVQHLVSACREFRGSVFTVPSETPNSDSPLEPPSSEDSAL